MPILTIQLLEGRNIEQKRELVKSVTKAVCDSIGVSPDKVSVYLCEMKKTDLAKGGVLRIDECD